MYRVYKGTTIVSIKNIDEVISFFQGLSVTVSLNYIIKEIKYSINILFIEKKKNKKEKFSIRKYKFIKNIIVNNIYFLFTSFILLLSCLSTALLIL